MSRFERLRKSFRDQRSAIHEYWSSVQYQAQLFVSGFEDYLELSEKDYFDPTKGVSTPYVSLGDIENGAFKEKRHHELSGSDSWLETSVRVTLDQARDTFPKRALISDFQFKKESDGIRIKSEDLALEIKIPHSESGYDFSPVYEKYLDALEKDVQYRP